MVCSGLPYSCLLLRMLNTYAERGLFVFICRILPRCLISIGLPVWPTDDLLHFLHCNLYIPLEQHIYMYIAIYIARNAMFILVRLKRLVTSCMSEIWYANAINFFVCVCVWVFFVCNGKPLLLDNIQIVSHSLCLACSVTGVGRILFM
jgi:hypothetical protein